MNKWQITLLTLMVAAAVLYNIQPSTQTPTHNSYTNYLKQFGKKVNDIDQFTYRARIFTNFLQQMQRHNSDPKNTWKMGVNQFSDLTQQQFIATYLGQKQSEIKQTQKIQLPTKKQKNSAPANVDWRTKNIITAIKNQGACGSCWAFAATAAHQSYQVQIKNQPKEISLSEQQLVDCSGISPYYNEGCNGGYGVRALQYIKDFGQTTTAQYPYKAVTQSTCQTQTGSYRIFGLGQAHGCDQIEQLIVRRPLAVRVDASNWHVYKSGIFNNCDVKINHAVFMVGATPDYWIIKNSWGPTWGQSGYIRLAKGDTCAVCQGPSFVI